MMLVCHLLLTLQLQDGQLGFELPYIIVRTFQLFVPSLYLYISTSSLFDNWISAGLLVSRAKDAINVEGLVSDLVKINQYRTLAANVEFLEGSACTIAKAYGLLKNMQFDDDPCAIEDYINKRLSKSDLHLEIIINCTNLTIDPTSYALLQKSPTNLCCC